MPEIPPPPVLISPELCCHKTNSKRLHSSPLCGAWVGLGSTWLKGMVPTSVTHFLFTGMQNTKTGVVLAVLHCIFFLFWLFIYLWILCFHLICGHSQEQVKVLALYWQNMLGTFCPETGQWWQICTPFFQFRLKCGQSRKGTVVY